MIYFIIKTLAIVTAVLLLIFSTFLITYKKNKNISHKILAAFLFANALYIIGYLLLSTDSIQIINKNLLNIIWISFGFLFGPLLYIYTISLTQNNFIFKKVYLFHFLPFTLTLFGILFYNRISFTYIYFIFLLYTIPYMVLCFINILKYRKAIKNYFSSIDKLKLSWLLYVVGAFFIMWMTDLSNFLLNFFGLNTSGSLIFLDFFSILINFVFTIIIFYKTLNQSEILSGISEFETKQKYALSRLNEQAKKDYLKILLDYFEVKKPFLNHEITILNVATELDIPVKYLSQIINESTGKNFYDFVNSYRVNFAQNLLIESINSKKTVLEIIYESGFNSKSAFNLAFKKQTGYTPTQFKNNTQTELII